MEQKSRFSQKDLEKLNEEELRNIVLKLQKTAIENESVMAQKDKVIADSRAQINILTQEVQLLRSQRFGRSSEQAPEDAIKDAMNKGQLVIDEVRDMIFNEAEAMADSAEAEQKATTVKEHTRKARPQGKQEEDLSKLRKEEEHFRIDEEKLKELFPDGYRELPEDISSQIECIPAEYYVKEFHVHVYCDRNDNSHIVRAEAPKKLFGKGLASASMVSGVANGKYTNSLPLYRIEQEFERNDVPISRQTMANWMVMASERYFSLIVDRLHELLFTHHVIHSDETPTLVTKDGRKAGSKSYMWVYCSNIYDPRRIVIFDYQKTRHHSHPEEFLKDFKGIVVTDGYEVYHQLARIRQGEITVAGCWVHMNRKFKDALKGLGKSGRNTAAGSIAQEAVDKIGAIFDLDNKLDDVTEETRLKVRQEKISPMVDEFFDWIKAHRKDVTLKSLTGKAMTYCLNQEAYLRVFLSHGDVPMENNTAERAIRPFCIGKKNWIMSDTIHGAQSSAIIYSIVETAKANNLKPYEYMKYLLEELPKHMDDDHRNMDFIDDLLPWSDKLPAACRKLQQQ